MRLTPPPKTPPRLPEEEYSQERPEDEIPMTFCGTCGFGPARCDCVKVAEPDPWDTPVVGVNAHILGEPKPGEVPGAVRGSELSENRTADVLSEDEIPLKTGTGKGIDFRALAERKRKRDAMMQELWRQRNERFSLEAEEVEPTLSEEQMGVVQVIESGENVMITGSAGTGKSTILKYLRQKGNIAVTATTGIAAVNVSGITIHSWAGLGKGEDDPETIAKGILNYSGKTMQRIQGARRLVIDEISMFSAEMFWKLDQVLRIVRDDKRPFGGIQIICVGDFCLKLGTQIIMADGSLRKVEDVNLGDEVMGPDSTPRKVMSLFRGVAPLYRVKQANGDAYTVTGNHQIALKRRKQPSRFPSKGDVQFVPAKDLMHESGKFLEVFGGYKAGCISIPFRPLELDPYFLGVWLGDGEKTCARITTPDPEIIAYCEQYAKHMGLLCKIRPERADTPVMRVSLTTGIRGNKQQNSIQILLRKYGVHRNKHIPEDFLLNSEANRLALLAGLLDTDGCWSGNRFIYCSVLERLAREVKQLADHLGFRAMLRRNSADNAWEITIGGDTWRIPTKVTRKQSVERSLGRSRLNSTVSITEEGEGVFAGFETDGDHLFLLADGTVTHNCQLPPVIRNPTERVFAFQSSSWPAANIRTILLTKIYRQKDERFIGALNDIRLGYVSPLAREVLAERFKQPDPDPENPPIIVHTTNANVDAENAEKLAAIQEPESVYEGFDEGEPGPLAILDKNCLAPKRLVLKPGARVMLLTNVKVEEGLSNGTLGTVVSCDEGEMPVVHFQSAGLTIPVAPHTFDLRVGGVEVASRFQFPLRLAWAITSHKTQGMTLSKVRVFLSKCFEDGQAYVALSRARTMEGLFIESSAAGCIRANRHALAFYGVKL